MKLKSLWLMIQSVFTPTLTQSQKEIRNIVKRLERRQMIQGERHYALRKKIIKLEKREAQYCKEADEILALQNSLYLTRK